MVKKTTAQTHSMGHEARSIQTTTRIALSASDEPGWSNETFNIIKTYQVKWADRTDIEPGYRAEGERQKGGRGCARRRRVDTTAEDWSA